MEEKKYDLEMVFEVFKNLEPWVKKLIDKVKEKIFNNELNNENIEYFKDSARKITSIYYLMKDKFSKKYRTTWERYFEHLREVANNILDLPNPSIDKVLIAICHDSIEDVWMPFDVLKYITNQDVAIATKALSKLPWQEYSNNKEEWKKLRNEEYFEHLLSFESMNNYIKEIIWIWTLEFENNRLILENTTELTQEHIDKITLDVFDVKFADRIHNLSTQWDINNLTQVEKKVEETKKYFLNTAKELNPEAYKKLKTLVLELEIKLIDAKKSVKEILDK